MTERRQAFKREPIEIELGGERVVSVGPVVWTQRNEFGDEVIRQHVEIVNDAVRMYVDPDTAAPQLEMKLAEKFSDHRKLFELGLDQETFQLVASFEPLYSNQIVEILLAICDVNGLEQLKPMLDPNSQTPTTIGGLVSGLMQSAGSILKTESGQDSSSPDSVEGPSEDSPIPSSASS